MALYLTNDIIAAAIEGFEGQKARIDKQIAELRQLQRGESTEQAVSASATSRKGRTMSAAGRARIAEAQRKRWAALKGQSPAASTAKVQKKRRLSAAGRKAISDATKKRWALKRAEAGKK